MLGNESDGEVTITASQALGQTEGPVRDLYRSVVNDVGKLALAGVVLGVIWVVLDG